MEHKQTMLVKLDIVEDTALHLSCCFEVFVFLMQINTYEVIQMSMSSSSLQAQACA